MKTLEYKDGSLWIIDQTQLPLNPVLLECCNYRDIADAIRSLKVRGAPAIGLAAAYGVALAAQAWADHAGESTTDVRQAMATLGQTRPTAVNLFWALDRMQRVLDQHSHRSAEQVAARLLEEAHQMLRDDEEVNRDMSAYGAQLIPDGANVLTHCNAGALATGAFGTALGAIIGAHKDGKGLHVWVDETRPLLQGARLTAWELTEARVPFTLITDSMAGHFMSRGDVDMVMVGADRIVANGDGANKIGTYSVAVLAQAHHLPFYFVAPTSTIDMATPSGEHIRIEERNPSEITEFRGQRVAPPAARAANPAFDVTPARLVEAIVTERGIVRAPFREGLREISDQALQPVESLGAVAQAE